MSTWPWIALYAITSVTGTERFELRVMDVKGGKIEAVAMSADGGTLLAQTTQAGALVAVVMREDLRANWQIPGLPWARLIGIDGQGTILGSYNARVKSGGMPRAFLYFEGQVRLIPIPVEPDLANTSFDPKAIGAGGEVFGTYHGTIDPQDAKRIISAAAIWDGGPQILGYQEMVGSMMSAVARTSNGILGHIPRWIVWTATKRTGSGVLPVYFHGGPSDPYTPLPLPRGIVATMPLFATPSGNLILGHGTDASGQPLTVIWYYDQPLVPKVGKASSTAILVSGSHDGKYAVGSILVRGGQTAVIWEAEKDVRSLQDFAVERGVLMPSGWRLLNAVGISPDGKRVYGTAVNGKNVQRPYVLWLDKRPRKTSN